MPGLKESDANLDNQIELLQRRISVLESRLSNYEQLREQLEEEHSFRKGVIERAAEGICACHSIHYFPYVQFTIWNSRMKSITGYSMEQINSLGWYQTMYPDEEVQQEARQRMDRMRMGEDLLNENWKITRADGQERILAISTSVLKTHDDQVHILALMQDVTEQEMYREQIEKRVATLEGLLSICSHCKKIRNKKGRWEQLEMYISAHSDTIFSHSICPDCMKDHYPEI